MRETTQLWGNGSIDALEASRRAREGGYSGEKGNCVVKTLPDTKAGLDGRGTRTLRGLVYSGYLVRRVVFCLGIVGHVKTIGDSVIAKIVISTLKCFVLAKRL